MLLIKNMFEHVRLDEATNPTYKLDMLVEFDDKRLHSTFVEFFNDVLPELENFGHVTQFRVCRNQEQHLRGNVLVEFDCERCV